MFPAPSAEQAVLEWVPRELTMTVTASPAKGLEPTLALTERLTGHGYRAVPHLSARLVRDDAHLAEIVARLTGERGAPTCSCPRATPTRRPAGSTARWRCWTGWTEMGRPFARVGITGYPESHPRIGDDVTVQAMWDKRHHATYIVSNLCLDAAMLRRWIARIRARGITLPLLRRAGRPGGAGPAAADGRGVGRRRVGQVPGRAHRLVGAAGPARRVQP